MNIMQIIEYEPGSKILYALKLSRLNDETPEAVSCINPGVTSPEQRQSILPCHPSESV